MSRTHVSEWYKWVSKEGMKSSLTAGLEVWQHQNWRNCWKGKNSGVEWSKPYSQNNCRRNAYQYRWKVWGWRKFVQRWLPKTPVTASWTLLQQVENNKWLNRVITADKSWDFQ
jgi:hypothetical protein